MAAEADTPEGLSVTKEGEGNGQFDGAVNKCSAVELNKSEGELDHHPDTVKYFESKNNGFDSSEGGHFLASPSDPKVDKHETCIADSSQCDELNQAEKEIPDNENHLQRSKEFEVVEETRSEEIEVAEETDEKAGQHSHGIANVTETISVMEMTEEASESKTKLGEHVQVISDQQDSISDNPQCIQKEANSSHEHVSTSEVVDGNADSSREQVSILLEETSVQENEASIGTLEKDLKVYEEKDPEATVATKQSTFEKHNNNDESTDESIGYDSVSTIAASPVIQSDAATLEADERAEDKLTVTSMPDDHEDKFTDAPSISCMEENKNKNESTIQEKDGVGLPLEKEMQENIPDTPFLTHTEEKSLHEVGNPDTLEVYPEVIEDIIKESPNEVKNQSIILEGTPQASDTASEIVNDDEISELQFDSPCIKHEENTHTKGEALDTGKASVGEEEDSQGFAAIEDISNVQSIQAIDHVKVNSTEHEGETETNLPEEIEPVAYELARPLDLSDEENETSTLRENADAITTAEQEKQVINLESFQEKGREEKVNTSYDITEDEIPEEKILKESEIAGVGETENTAWEVYQKVEKSEEILSPETVKCEEGEGEGTNPAPFTASKEDDRDEAIFAVKAAEDDDDYTSGVMVSETSAKVTSNDDEDSPQAYHKYEPSRDVMPEETKIEFSEENAEVTTCIKDQSTIQNTQESSETDKKEETESTNVTKEIDTAIEEVLETVSTEQETGEHALGEIHTVADATQDFNDKETNEENSTEYQARIEAADSRSNIEEKNLEEHAIQKLSSSLVVDETTKEISNEEEKEEAHANYNEPDEATNTTEDTKSETTEHKTDPNKDFCAPISEEEIHAEESNKTLGPNDSVLSDVSEAEIEQNILEKDGPTVTNSDSTSGVVTNVTTEPENEEQVKKTDIDIEDIDVKEEEYFNSKENLEELNLTTAYEGETLLKEAETENKEQIKVIDTVTEGKGLEIDETPLEVESTDIQADEYFNSEENWQEQNPTATYEGDKFQEEAEEENMGQIKVTDISPEEKSPATTNEIAFDNEDIDVKEKETFNSKENLEEQIPTTADEGETFLKEVKAENMEQTQFTDILPEEKGLSTVEPALDIKDVDVQAQENFNSEENLEKQIPTAADEGEPGLREDGAENNDHVKNDIAPEEKVPPTILTDETALEDTDVQKDGNFNSNEVLEKQIPTEADEGEEKIEHKNIILDDTPVKVYNTELETTGQSFQVQSLEEAEPILGVEGDSHKSDEHPEKNSMIVEEVFDEQKITDRDFTREETVEGNVAYLTPDSTEKDTVIYSQENENETKDLKEEGNGDDISTEYIPEDGREEFKGEILKESQTAGVGESTACETNNIGERSEEILNTLPVKYEEGQHCSASAEASKEEDENEDTFSVKVAEDDNVDNGAVTVIESSANVNGDESSPQGVQKYEPGEEKLLDVMPKETKAEPSSEIAEVIPCTKEERTIQNIQESSDKEQIKEDTTTMNNTEGNDTGLEEVFESINKEQEAGEQALREIHTVEDHHQEFNDKEKTEENSTESQECIEAADVSTNIVEKNYDEQPNQELSSLLVGVDTTKDSTKEEDNVSSLKEEEKEAPVECIETIEATNMTRESNFGTLEDSTEPKGDLNAPSLEELTHTEEINETLALNTDIAPKEKALTAVITDGTPLETESIDAQAEANVNSKEFWGNQIPTVANEGLEKIGHGNLYSYDTPVEINYTELVGDKTVGESFQVQSHEEAEPKLGVLNESRESEDRPENNNMTVEEPQLLEQVLDEPKSTDRECNTTDGNAITTPESIQEETVTNFQDNDKETEKLAEGGSTIENIKASDANDEQDAMKFKGEILIESQITGVGESTACETNKIAERSEEIVNISPVKYDDGEQGEGNSTDLKKVSEEERNSEIFSVKVADDNDDTSGAVTDTEPSAKVTSKGEEDSVRALEKYEPGEEVPVQNSDVAYENEVSDLEVEASFAERPAEETSLQKEGHIEVSKLAPEKLDVNATEEEFKEGSEIVPKSDCQSIDVVSKDETTCQTLDEGILQEQLQIPSSTLVSEENELKASQPEHETTTQDKNIEEEHAAEKEVPADESTGDLFVARPVEETCLQKEELKASDSALDKRAACKNEEEIKENVEAVSDSDSQLIDAVSKDETVADQALEKELKTYEHEHETTTRDKNIEEEHAKEIEVPAEENGGDFLATRSVEGAFLQKELAPENPDASETEEEIKEMVPESESQSTDVVSKDEIIAYHAVHEGVSTEQLQIPSSTLLSKAGEHETYQHEHETTTEDKNKEEDSTEEKEVPCLQQEEPRELKASELAPEKLDVSETEEEIKDSFETVSNSDSQSIDAASKDEINADQTTLEGLVDRQLQIPSYTLLPKAEEHETYQHEHATSIQDKNIEEEHAKQVEVPVDENGGDFFAAGSVEETILQKEETKEVKVSELAPKELDAGETEGSIKETFETVPKSDSQSVDVVPRDEIVSGQTLHEGISNEQLQIPSAILLSEETEINASEHEHGTTFHDKNIEESVSDSQTKGDTSTVEETSLPEEGFTESQDSTINGKHVEDVISSKIEENQSETRAEANETVKNEVSNEEMNEDKELPRESGPGYVKEESHQENKGKAEEYRVRTNEDDKELYEEVDEKGIASEKFERQLTFEDVSIKDHDALLIEDKTIQDGLPEEEKRNVEEAAFEFDLKNHQHEKDSITEVSQQDIPGVEEAKEISQDVTKPEETSHATCKTEIPTESYSNESTRTSIPTGNRDGDEVHDTKSRNDACVATEGKDVEEEEEDEEHEENEHKNEDHGYDTPVMVEASRDAAADGKVSHKKSHNILSGIKHSISKVKKAITGKSSHSKTQPAEK